MSTVLTEALNHVKVIEEPEEDLVPRLEAKLRGLYGIEEDTKATLEARLTLARRNKHMAGHAEVDPVIFKWRWQDMLNPGAFLPKIPLPQICPLTLDSNEFSLAGTAWGFNDGLHAFPGSVQRNYRDVVRVLTQIEHKKIRSYTLTFRWGGVIPQESKDLIEENKLKYDKILLLTEAPADAWTLQRSVPVHVDPLIVGVKYGGIFLLGRFDPTTLEEYVASEFTS